MKNLKQEKFGKAALIVAVLALVVALGGTAIAVTKIGNGSITGKKIKNGAVTNKKLADGAVRANKLATIRTASKTMPIAAGPNSSADTVSCNSDELVIGGGAAYQVTDANKNIMIRSSFKDTALNGWRVAVHNPTGPAQNYTIEAYCIKK